PIQLLHPANEFNLQLIVSVRFILGISRHRRGGRARIQSHREQNDSRAIVGTPNKRELRVERFTLLSYRIDRHGSGRSLLADQNQFIGLRLGWSLGEKSQAREQEQCRET